MANKMGAEIAALDLMDALQDPQKRALILQLLAQQKGSKSASKKKHETPIKKVKKLHCESPTALLRRRALEKRDRDTCSESSSTTSQSDSGNDAKPPALPFDQLLKGVIAYVEVKKKDTDRSEGIKALMQCMGANIRDKFTGDVTHVVFKDGSFNTYQKAKLMKVHLVSVLWIDAVRKKGARVPEKNYPAFGVNVCDANVSIMCSQLQKDYEDIVKDEKRRSLGVIAQSAISDMNRRRTIMTPASSTSSYHTAKKSSQTSEDHEVEKITSVVRSDSPDFTSDDSDCGVINGEGSKRPSYLDLLQISSDEIEDDSPKVNGNARISSSSNDSMSLISRVTVRKNKRKTINVIENKVLTPVKVAKNVFPDEKKLQESSTMSSLRLSSETDRTKSGLGNYSSKSKSSLENQAKRASTSQSVMSSLRLSSGDDSKNSLKSKRKKKAVDEKENHELVTTISTMSSLRLSNSSVDESISKKRNSSTNVIEKGDSRVSSTSLNSCNDKNNYSSNLDDKEKENKSQKTSVKKRNRKNDLDVSSPSLNRRSLRSLNSDNENGDSEKKKKKSQKTPVNKTQQANDSFNRRSFRSSITSVNSDNVGELSTNDMEKEDSRVSSTFLNNCNDKSNDFAAAEDSAKSGNVDDKEKENKSQKTSVRKRNKKNDLDVSSTSLNRRSLRTLNSDNENDDVEKESKKSQKTPINKRQQTNDSFNRRSLRSSSTSLNDDNENDNSTNNNNNRNRRASSVSVIAKRTPNVERNRRASSVSSNSKNINNNVKKTRKLYTPNELPEFLTSDDEKERLERVKNKSAKKSPEDGVFVNPNDVLIAPLPAKKNSKNNSAESDFSGKENEDQGSSSEECSPEIVSKKAKKVRNKKDKKQAQALNSGDSDEQTELLRLLEKRTGEAGPSSERKRRSERISLSQYEVKYCSSTSTKSSDSHDLPITPIKRRSTMDFERMTQSQKKLRMEKKKLPSIVCTKMHRNEVLNFENVVKKLGGFFIENRVTDHTTHLVAGEEKRTINMLKALARGCWILKHEWLLRSQRERKWLPEEDYEATEFSPAVQECRLQRQAFGPAYTMEIFSNLGNIYIGKSTTPSPKDLRDLVILCKGTLTVILRNAKIVVGEFVDQEDVTCVTETWILDSITYNKLKPFKKYCIKPVLSPCV